MTLYLAVASKRRCWLALNSPVRRSHSKGAVAWLR
jgi:hypothetical protein